MDYTKTNPSSQAKEHAKDKPPIEKKDYGATTMKKQSVTDRLIKRIVKTDFNTWKNHMIDNVIIPKAINLVRDTVVNSVDMFFYGKTTPNKQNGNGAYFAYNNVSSQYNGSRFDSFIPQTTSATRTAANGYETILNTIFESREKACEFVDDVRNRILACNGITLLEVLAMMQRPYNYTDDRFGWKNANDFNETIVYATGGGFAVNMPKMLEFASR